MTHPNIWQYTNKVMGEQAGGKANWYGGTQAGSMKITSACNLTHQFDSQEFNQLKKIAREKI